MLLVLFTYGFEKIWGRLCSIRIVIVLIEFCEINGIFMNIFKFSNKYNIRNNGIQEMPGEREE